MSELHFLPWLVTGLSRAATGTGGRAQIAPRATIGGVEHTRTFDLAGPGDVSSIDSSVWGTRFPAPAANDAEETFMVSIEVTPADLPWRLSRGPIDDNAQLQPWMVLVVIDLEVGVELRDGVGSSLEQLVLSPDAVPSTQLPDLNHRDRFAHVQSSLQPSEVALRPTASGVIARLLCPRDLAENRTYLAAVVPATAEGVQAGLGLATSAPTSTANAWSLDDSSLDAAGITLPVYTHWTFSTGPAGDFESLTGLVRAAPLGPRTGVAALDVSKPGPTVPGIDKEVLLDYRGALRAETVKTRDWDPTHRAHFRSKLNEVLDASVDRPKVSKNPKATYRPERDDPVVAPPLYGEIAAGLDRVPGQGSGLEWATQLNLNPVWRAAAGLGANAVRKRAADYVAAAWRHLADAPAAITATNQAIFSSVVSQRYAAVMAEADDSTLLAVTSRLPLARRAGVASGVPTGTIDPVVSRVTRSSSAAGRNFRSALAETTNDRSDVRSTSVAHTVATVHRASLNGDLTARPVREFALFTGVVDAVTENVALTTGPDAIVGPRLSAPRVSHRTITSSISVSGESVAAGIRSTLDPSADVAARLAESVPAATASLAGLRSPQRLSVELSFPSPIVEGIVQQGEHFVMPGLEDFENNRAAAAVVEGRHVAAVLAGANHELLRELLWHGVPIDLAQTPIRRYWASGDSTSEDISAIGSWKGDLVDVTTTAGSDLSVMIVRATLFERYPGARLHLMGATWDGNRPKADPSRVQSPVFEGWLDARTRYAAFAAPLDVLEGALTSPRRTADTAGWFLAFEEAATAPRFRPPTGLSTNAAALAAASYQPPFRGLIHVAELTGAI